MGILFRVAAVPLSIVVLSAGAFAQQASSGGAAVALDQVVDRLIKMESTLLGRLGNYHPVVEIYLQSLLPDPQIGAVPAHDDYYLGQFDGTDAPAATPLNPARGWFRPAGLMNRPFGFDYVPSGFAAMTIPDLRVFDRERYDFTFVRREFLDEVRCVVLEVRPKNRDEFGFKGRIWVDDRDFTIVRFNGISREADSALSRFFRHKLSFHLDSWRVNVQPGVWLPGYVYFEETDFESHQPKPRQVPKLRGQVRLWGYELSDASAPSAFATVELGGGVRDSSESVRQISPVLSQRSWERQAEENVLERLTKTGLLAPPGPVDAVLETVLNNVQITNEVSFDPPLRVRVLLTTPLESFLVGRTIVLSKGLIDVLPDEASLAMVLTHELSHVVLGHLLIDTKFAFADRLMIPDGDVLPLLRLQRTPQEEIDADAKTLELLGRSPYQDKLAGAGLFLQAVVAHAKPLRSLIQPHVGDYVIDAESAFSALIEKAPALAPAQLDQIAALPLGARLVVDPWSNRVDLIRSPAVPLSWAREKLPLAITPMAPVLRYVDGNAPAATR